MEADNLKVVILCGGLGTRLKEETEFKPKPMVIVGNKPLLWHIMKIYSHYGFKDFILCLGYKGEMIKEYFSQSKLMSNDSLLNSNDKKEIESWNITLADTGLETNTGGRIKKIEKYINEDNFMVTYGDGVADINIKSLLNYHLTKNKIATLTSIQPMSRFGIIEFDNEGTITSFKEKPKLDGWISGGFFVFKKGIFDYLKENDILEEEPLKKLARDKQLSAYLHQGFWECMDTFKDLQRLNQFWNTNKAFWKIWE
jgi:glucose-1-phosphate cytidylyltransferase